MMVYQKLADLVLKLEKRTAEGLVDWRATDVPEKFHAGFGRYSIAILRTPGMGAGGTAYQIAVFNANKQQIECFADDALSDFRHPNGSFHASMRNIHETAQRIALGSEHAINAILSVLDDDQAIREINRAILEINGAGGRT